MPNPQDALRAEIAAQQQKLDTLTAQLLALTLVQDENETLRAQITTLNATIAQLTEDRNAAVKALEDYKASHPDTPPVEEPPVEEDWATESAGALVAYEFKSAGPEDANLAARHRSPGNTLPICYWVPDENTYQKPVIDDQGMRFDVTNKGSADCVVSLRGSYGKNSKLRLRWWSKANGVFAGTAFYGTPDPVDHPEDKMYPGIKKMIVATLDASSPSNKFVLTYIDQHKYDGGYRYGWNTGLTENFEPAIDNIASDFDWQPKQGQPATCLYTVVNKTMPPSAPVPGCNTIAPDVWVLEELEIDTGDVVEGTDGKAWHCEYRYYKTVKGSARTLVFDYGKTTRGYQGRRAEAWTAIWLVPFMTGRDLTQQFPDGVPSVWYKRFQVAKGSQPSVIDVEPVPSDPPPATTGPLPIFTPTRDASGNVSNYGALPLRRWHEIADTKMVKLLPQLPQSNNNDMNNVMANWGGSANDPATGDMHLHGGAHGANGENSGFYTFNADRADWRITVPPLYMGAVEKAYLDKCGRLYAPNDPSSVYNGSWNMGMPPEFMTLPVPGSVTGDPTIDNPNATSSGKVYAHHCWWKMVWVEWTRQVFVSLIRMYFLDPATGKVTFGQKHGNTDYQYNIADPVTKRIYGLTRAFSANDYWGFREYDPVADTPLIYYPIRILNDAGRDLDSAKYSFSANNMHCVVGREIVHWNPITKGWFAFNMDTKKWRALMWQPLPFQSGAGDYAGVYYSGKILACQGWGKVYEVDPTTGAVAPFAVSGPDTFGSTAVNNGLFGRLNLRGNLLFALDWATSNAKVMRLA